MTRTKAFLAVTWAGMDPPERWDLACGLLAGAGQAQLSTTRDTAVCVVGADEGDVLDPASGAAMLHLTRGARVGDRDVTDADVATWLSGDGRHPGLDEVLPPFAACYRSRASEPLRLGTDYLGFRSVYVASGEDWAALSTSSKALAELAGARLDRDSLAAFSLVGWRIGEATHYVGVSKLPAGAVATLRSGTVEVSTPAADLDPEPYSRLADAVRDAADLLRTSVNAMLDDHPDTCLQLTGGLDSRILLGAVERDRRADLRAMTLEAAGNPDADMAAALAARHGMAHRVVPVSEVQKLSPEQALALAMSGGHRLDYSSDPLAWAALALAENSLEQRPRLAGLGGEVVRGFYYVGPVLPMQVSRRRVAGLARWRLFPNESVPDEVLGEELAATRREATLGQLWDIFTGLPAQWNQATDDFYLWQRMQRWAGVTTTSTVHDRLVVNPMLDPRFVAIGRRVPPTWKAGMRFLSSIMCQLDPALARLPLDGRPPPEVYARPTPRNRARLGALTTEKARRKITQRLRSGNRPAVGGETLADLVVQQWRADPALLEPAADAGVLRPGWLEDVLAGAVRPTASSVGFVVTLAAAGAPVRCLPT